MTYLSSKKLGDHFEELGHRTMLECRDEAEAIRICALEIQSHEVRLQPELATLAAEIAENSNRHLALHDHLYDRPAPINDAAMLVRGRTIVILSSLAVLAALASVAGNMITFLLLGFGVLITLISAVGMTALPLIVGHLAYEWIMASSRWLQALVAIAAVVLCFVGIVRVGQARGDMLDKVASAAPVANSYVDGDETNPESVQAPNPHDASESKIRRTTGQGLLLIVIAVELALSFMVGRIVWMQSEEDYTAWRELKKLGELLISLEEQLSIRMASLEVAKKRCLAGILRAKNMLNKRQSPYHKRAAMLVLTALFACRAWGQNMEGILIDTSGSISRGGTTNKLFHEYLIAAKKLLFTEPANTRVWVSSISTDSFGGPPEILKGWTPDARGVFTDDLNRARHQLASAFESKSTGMAPVARGTDIFGGLWRMKALFESGPKPDTSRSMTKTIWIFSDMMNETKEFPMPELLDKGPERMLERARVNGLLVPLNGYRIYVYGASSNSLTPQVWIRMRSFWAMYFSAASADLVAYSSDSDVLR
jgi:hypothetical protein